MSESSGGSKWYREDRLGMQSSASEAEQEGEGLCTSNPHHPGAGPLVMQVPDHVGLG